MSHSSIVGTASLQTLSKDNNTVVSTKLFKQGLIESVKGDDGQLIFLRISNISPSNKISGQTGYPLMEIQIFDRFIFEGKATIKLPKSSVQVMISNCAPGDLKLFLTTLKCKANISSANISELKKNKSLGKLLPQSISALDVISPIRKSDKYKLQGKKLEQHFPNIKPITPDKKHPLDESFDYLSTPPTKKLKLQQFTSTPNAKKSLLDMDDLFNSKPKVQKSISELNTSLNESGQLTEYYELTNEQRKIMECVKSGANVFYTGSAGTGKTFLLKKIIGILVPQYIAVTASTGIAASLIDGCTLHNFAGVGSVVSSITVAVSVIMRKPQLLLQWRKCKHLIIDEISLITAEYFDYLDQIGRVIRNNPNVPFGGIQLIVSGDFFQLPPITKTTSQKKNNYRFVFQSKVWDQAFKEIHFLTDVKRQSDKEFIKILSEIRVGQCSELTEKKLKKSKHQIIEKNGIIPTMLCTHKADVEEKNTSNLLALKGEGVDFIAKDSISGHTNTVDAACAAVSKLTLKIGAQVMLLKNLDVQAGLANGSRGVVINFEPATENRYPIVRFKTGKVITVKPESFSVSISSGGQSMVIIRHQIPMKLAYAISIHKSQGMTLDCVDLYLAKTFESGQAYVALSRCKSLDSLRVMDWSNHCVRADIDVIKFYEKYQNENTFL